MSTSRLDNFTDAAFAFAVTLLVIGGAGAPASFDQLAGALGEMPAFAFGFAIIAMFWFAHVRWRRLRGEGDWLSILLTVLLVFLVLIYIQPLRGMAAAVGLWFTGKAAASAAHLRPVRGLRHRLRRDGADHGGPVPRGAAQARPRRRRSGSRRGASGSSG